MAVSGGAGIGTMGDAACAGGALLQWFELECSRSFRGGLCTLAEVMQEVK